MVKNQFALQDTCSSSFDCSCRRGCSTWTVHIVQADARPSKNPWGFCTDDNDGACPVAHWASARPLGSCFPTPGQRFWTNLGCLDDVQESSMFSHLIELAKAVGRRNDSIRCLFKRWFLFERRRNENLVSQSERKNFQEFQGEQKVFYRIHSTIARQRETIEFEFFSCLFPLVLAHSNWNSPPEKKVV